MALTMYLIKYIQSFKHSIMIFIKKGDQSSYSKMHVHIHMHDLLHLPRYTRTLSTYASVHIQVFMNIHVIQPRHKP